MPQDRISDARRIAIATPLDLAIGRLEGALASLKIVARNTEDLRGMGGDARELAANVESALSRAQDLKFGLSTVRSDAPARKEAATEKAKMTQAESDVASVIDATSAAVDSIGQAKRQLQFAPWASRMGPGLKNEVDRAVEHLNGADASVRAIAKAAGDWGVRAADAAKYGNKKETSEKGVVPMSRDEFARYAGLLRDLSKRVGALNTSMIGIGQVEAFAAASTDYTTTRSKIWDGSDGIQKALSSFEEAAGASFKAAPASAPAPKRKERGDDERIGDRDPASFLPVYKD